MMIRVAVVDDQRLITRMFSHFVASQEGMTAVGEAYDGYEAVRLCLRERPDVVLMDLVMPGMDGITATHEILASLPQTAVVVLTAYTDDEHAFRAVGAGARGYLHKNCTPEELAWAVRKVHAGELATSPEIAHKASEALRGEKVSHKQTARGSDALKLTKREIEVVRAIARGKSSRQIAEALHLSERTVRNHLQNAYTKLQVNGRAQATMYAVRQGLVDPNEVGIL